MQLKLACADFTFPLLPYDAVLDLIAAMGFTGVDIGLFQNRSHLQPSDQYTDVLGNAKALKAKLDARGLVATDIFLQADNDFYAFPFNSSDPAKLAHARDLFAKTLAYAQAAGSPHVTILPGVVEDDGYEASFARCAEGLKWCVAEAQKAGIILGTEAHVGSIASNPAQAERMVQAVPGLTLSLDYTHFVRMGMNDRDLDFLLQYAHHFHARGAAPGRLQTTMSESAIDYARVVKKMKEINYPGWVGVEYTWNDWENCNRNDNISESMICKQQIVDAFNA